MARNNALAFAAGGLVVVALSFGAGFLGGAVGSSGSSADVAPPPQALPDSVIRGRIEELERRLANLEERMRVTEDSAEAALARGREIDGLRAAVESLRRSGGAPLPATGDAPELPEDDGTSAQMTSEQRAELEAKQREKLREFVRQNREKMAGPLLKQRLGRLADATAQGEADRRSQLFSETKQFAVKYALTPADEDRVREILIETAENSVRELAPYLGGGLERADHATVKDKLFELWDARDRALEALLDDNERKVYREDQKAWREAFAKALDGWNDERLGNR